MWLWASELHELGFRRRSERYWRCEGRHGLPAEGHLSIFSWGEQAIPAGRAGARYLVELTEFHVTFAVGREHLHFYYHEGWPNEWHPAGHTSSAEIRRAGGDPAELCGRADLVAGEFVDALGGVLVSRES
jgi:hypothetical protein